MAAATATVSDMRGPQPLLAAAATTSVSSSSATAAGPAPAADAPPRPPFVNATSKLSLCTRVRMALLLPLVVLRIVLLLILVVVASTLARVAVAGLPPAVRNSTAPLAPWRRRLMGGIPLLARAVLVTLGYWPWAGVRVRYVGGATAVACTKPAVVAVVANHVCAIEPFVMAWVCWASAGALLVPISAAENASYPLLGPIATGLRTVFVDREDAASRSAVGEAMVGAMRDPAVPPLMVCPEGTAGDGTALLSFGRGAFGALLPVQPLAITYAAGYSDPAWVAGGPSLPALALRQLCSVYNVARVAVLPVMAPTPEEVAAGDAGGFADRVQAAIAGAMGVPPTQYSATDQLGVMRRAMRKGYTPAAALRMVPPGGVLSMKLKVRRPLLTAALDAYIAADGGRSGCVSAEAGTTAAGVVLGGPLRDAPFPAASGVTFPDFLQRVAEAAAAVGWGGDEGAEEGGAAGGDGGSGIAGGDDGDTGRLGRGGAGDLEQALTSA